MINLLQQSCFAMALVIITVLISIFILTEADVDKALSKERAKGNAMLMLCRLFYETFVFSLSAIFSRAFKRCVS